MSATKGKSIISGKEVIFFFDLSTDFLKKKRLRKAVKEFMDQCEEINEGVSYGFLLFKENEEEISLFNEKQDPILEKIDKLWDDREEEKSYFENGMYSILGYVLKECRTNPKEYRIIVLSDRPSSQKKEYYTALYDLVSKAKTFSSVIDIIRIGDKKFYKDDVKLKRISSESSGRLLYCQNDKELKTFLSSLAELKKEESFRISDEGDKGEENLKFYEGLASELVVLTKEDNKVCSLCEEEVCKICEDSKDKARKCQNCNTCFHDCCIAQYSFENNIGVYNIFRCPKCGTLLKIEKILVEPLVQGKKKKDKDSSFLLEEESVADDGQKEEVGEEPLEEKEDSGPKSFQIGGFFGTTVMVDKDSGSGIKIKAEKKVKTQASVSEDLEDELIEEVEQVDQHINDNNSSKSFVRFCPVCGDSIKGSKVCPKCGSPVD